MTQELRVPVLPESVAEATVLDWRVDIDQPIQRDDIIVELETDKVVLEVPAPADGKLIEIRCPTGAVVTSEEILGLFEAGQIAVESTAPEPGAETTPRQTAPAPEPSKSLELPQPTASTAAPTTQVASSVSTQSLGERSIRREPMSRLRQTIANRLLDAQHSAAILSTFNEVDLSEVMALRKRYSEAFEARYTVRLGYMSFFVRACVEALQAFPLVNAQIEGTDVLYHDYFDIGIAVSSPRGLVVPVLRDANTKRFSEIEQEIAEFGDKAKNGTLAMEELTGGTFTITNGGVFGSLLSTPILNPPQSGILGMHKIQQRPIAMDGEVVIRPMMYLALSYDHRLVDGRDAVGFLVGVKETLEDPARLLLNI